MGDFSCCPQEEAGTQTLSSFRPSLTFPRFLPLSYMVPSSYTSIPVIVFVPGSFPEQPHPSFLLKSSVFLKPVKRFHSPWSQPSLPDSCWSYCLSLRIPPHLLSGGPPCIRLSCQLLMDFKVLVGSDFNRDASLDSTKAPCLDQGNVAEWEKAVKPGAEKCVWALSCHLLATWPWECLNLNLLICERGRETQMWL